MTSNNTSTTQVLFSFRHLDTTDNDFHLPYPLPTSLVGPEAHLTPGYANRFQDAVEPILAEQQGRCLKACPKQCIDCSAPTTHAFQVPNSSLHHSPETDGKSPTVQVMVLPLCNKSSCAENAAANMRMFQQRALASQKKAEQGACEVCEKMEGTSRCTGCKQVSYCGRACQKKDWKRHKLYCGKSVQELGKATT